MAVRDGGSNNGSVAPMRLTISDGQWLARAAAIIAAYTVLSVSAGMPPSRVSVASWFALAFAAALVGRPWMRRHIEHRLARAEVAAEVADLVYEDALAAWVDGDDDYYTEARELLIAACDRYDDVATTAEAWQ